MAAIACGILTAPEKVWEPLSDAEKKNLAAWLDQINHHTIPDCNWQFFRILTNLALKSVGMPYSPELLEEDIDTNRLFVYMVNGQMQAVFAFVLGEDPTYQTIEDGQWLNDTLPYGTIHRLASAGKRPGVATDVINWCLEHCESLRADTHADNKAMRHILEETGFTRCGVIHVADGSPRFAYQRMSLTMPLEH